MARLVGLFVVSIFAGIIFIMASASMVFEPDVLQAVLAIINTKSGTK